MADTARQPDHPFLRLQPSSPRLSWQCSNPRGLPSLLQCMEVGHPASWVTWVTPVSFPIWKTFEGGLAVWWKGLLASPVPSFPALVSTIGISSYLCGDPWQAPLQAAASGGDLPASLPQVFCSGTSKGCPQPSERAWQGSSKNPGLFREAYDPERLPSSILRPRLCSTPLGFQPVWTFVRPCVWPTLSHPWAFAPAAPSA